MPIKNYPDGQYLTDCDELAEQLDDVLLIDLRPAEEVKALYESKGVTPDKNIIVFCQGGYRSANTFIALTSLGYPRVRNYVGSWTEWGNRDDSCIELPGAG